LSTSGSVNSLSTGISSITVSTRNLGATTAAALGGGATFDPATGKISPPAYTTYNANGTTSTVGSIGQAIDNINNNGIRYFHTDPTGADSIASAANTIAIGANAVANVDDSVAIGTGATTSAAVPVSSASVSGVNFGPYAGNVPIGVFSVGAPGAERQITNVAAGRVTAASTDAVNGSQLYQTNVAVVSMSTGLSTTDSKLADLSLSTSTSVISLSTAISTNTTNIVSLSGSTSTAISVLSTSTQINITSLSTSIDNTNSAIISLSTTINGGGSKAEGIAADMKSGVAPTVTTGSNSVSLGAGSTDDGRSNVVSVGSATQQRQITNVAPGTQGTDAVNYDQLNALSTSVSQSLTTQQTQIDNLGAQLNQTQQALQQTNAMAREGVAAATALTMVPQVEPGKTIFVGMGVARFAGQSGMAFGVSAHITSQGVLKVGIGLSGSNKTYGAGYGLNW
jgi:trimeric autotransporter adhesin